MADNAPRPSRGCFFYGTITLVLVVIGVMVGVYFGARKAIQAVVAKYTATAPAAIPQLNLSPADQDRIARELAQNAQRAASGQGSHELVLNEQELNVLLGQSPDLKDYRKQVYLQPEGDKLKAQMSVPLDQFQHWKTLGRKIGSASLTNRYLNGTAFLSVGVTNGMISLSITNLVVNGESLPAEFTSRVQGQNFAQAANQNPQVQAALQKVEKIEVKDGKVVLEFKDQAR